MIRAIALFALLCAALPLRAETVILTASKAGCTRASLQGVVDKYLTALKKGRPSLMPLAVRAKYIENRKEIPFGQGIWKTALEINHSRSLLDVDTCETFTEIVDANSSNPHVIGTRLKIVDDKISEAEALITTKKD